MLLLQLFLLFAAFTVNTSAVTDTGTFENPSIHVRPKFRYWLPDASVDPSNVADDIQSIGAIGAGGIEFCNYYSYGGELGGSLVTDWDVYGFGTPAYNTILKAAAQAIKDNGLIMDFAMGPQSGKGVPAEIDNPGLAYDLVSYNVTVAAGQTYNGKIPGFASHGTLVSVTTAMIVNETFYTIPIPLSLSLASLDGLGTINYTETYIAPDSLADITSTVKSDRTVKVEFPTSTAKSRYVIYASYYELFGQGACVPGQHPINFIQNGSFAVDHFSPRGAKLTTDFLEQYVLINGVKELFQEIGNYIWENSVESISNML